MNLTANEIDVIFFKDLDFRTYILESQVGFLIETSKFNIGRVLKEVNEDFELSHLVDSFLEREKLTEDMIKEFKCADTEKSKLYGLIIISLGSIPVVVVKCLEHHSGKLIVNPVFNDEILSKETINKLQEIYETINYCLVASDNLTVGATVATLRHELVDGPTSEDVKDLVEKFNSISQ